MGRGPRARREGRPKGGPRAARGRRPTRRSPEALTNLEALLLSLERALARRDGNGIPGGLGELLDDEFVELGASGRRWDRAATIAQLDASAPMDVAITHFRVAVLRDDVALATYRSDASGMGVPSRPAWRSSVWVRRDGRWRLRFHQGTLSAAGDAFGT